MQTGTGVWKNNGGAMMGSWGWDGGMGGWGDGFAGGCGLGGVGCAADLSARQKKTAKAVEIALEPGSGEVVVE